MNHSIRYTNEEWRVAIEKETERHILKMEKLLKSYAPDLVQLHGNIEKHPRKENYLFSVNLLLPTGTLHATGEGADVRITKKYIQEKRRYVVASRSDDMPTFGE